MQKRLLAVDDSMTIRQAITLTLEKEGYQVITAVDGVDALEKLNGEKFHALLVDVNMPRMDGITLIGRVRALPQYKFTPIIVVTTESGGDKKDAGKAAGATGWIVKPFQPDQLIAVVKKVCP